MCIACYCFSCDNLRCGVVHVLCADCALSASFLRECSEFSYVARECVELTVHKETAVIEEIKEVELRSRRAQFIYDRNDHRIQLQRRGHAPSRLPMKNLRRLVAQKERSKGICMEGYP